MTRDRLYKWLLDDAPVLVLLSPIIVFVVFEIVLLLTQPSLVFFLLLGGAFVWLMVRDK